jgi:hypothetical protein
VEPQALLELGIDGDLGVGLHVLSLLSSNALGGRLYFAAARASVRKCKE